jgi:hypothetical protein
VGDEILAVDGERIRNEMAKVRPALSLSFFDALLQGIAFSF